MKKTPLILTTVAAIVLTTVLFGAEKPVNDVSSPIGTWQLVSTKYGEAKEFSEVSKDEPHIKMITPTHFSWVIYDPKTKLLSASMGGSYRLEGAKYTETVEFYFPEGMKVYLGKDQMFTIKIEGDRLLQSGKLSDGQKIEELWQRVK